MQLEVWKENGVLRCNSPTFFRDLPDGKRYELKEKKEIRSVSQNRFYWACLGMIAEEVGYVSPDMAKHEKAEIVDGLHEIMKEKYLGFKLYRQKDGRRKKIKVPKSSASLDTGEFKKYLDRIRTDHPYIPDPEDKHLLEFLSTYYWR